MRAFLLAGLLLTITFAGCLGGADEDLSPDDPAERGYETFRALGANVEAVELATPPEVGTTWHKLTGFGGAEPTMAISPTGAIFAAAGSAGIRSMDGGETWEEVISIGLPVESPADRVYRSWDPMMWYDKWTERVYYDPMFPPLACTQLSWTTDDGASWTTNPAVCHPPPMDHQKLFSGPPGPDAPAIAGVAHETVLYQCYNQVVATQCGISYDGGLSWPVTSPVAVDARDGCGGINGHGVVSDDGIVALPLSSCAEMTMAISTDSGLTWTLSEIPGGLGIESFDPDVVFDDNGTLYVLFRGDDHDAYLARSFDDGASWEGPFAVTPPVVNSTFFHTMNAGDDGRLAMSFVGTADWGGDPNDAPGETHWHLHIVTTEDRDAAEPRFVARQVTPDADPVHTGLICTGGIGCSTGRDLLEFIDSAVAPDGTFNVIYTDSCAGPCAEMGGNQTVADKADRQVGLAKLLDWPLHAAS